MMIDKEIQKERAGLIRYLLTLPESRDRAASSFTTESRLSGLCLCAKGQIVKRYLGHVGKTHRSGSIEYPFYDNVDKAVRSLGMTDAQWNDMELRYEGVGFWEKDVHTFKEIATWLQTLKGWPTVL